MFGDLINPDSPEAASFNKAVDSLLIQNVMDNEKVRDAMGTDFSTPATAARSADKPPEESFLKDPGQFALFDAKKTPDFLTGKTKDGYNFKDTALPNGMIAREMKLPNGTTAKSLLPAGSISPLTDRNRKIAANTGAGPESADPAATGPSLWDAGRVDAPGFKLGGTQTPVAVAAAQAAPSPALHPTVGPGGLVRPDGIAAGNRGESKMYEPGIPDLPFSGNRNNPNGSVTKVMNRAAVPRMFNPNSQDLNSRMPFSDSEAGARPLHNFFGNQQQMRVGNVVLNRGRTAGQTATNYRDTLRGASRGDRQELFKLGAHISSY